MTPDPITAALDQLAAHHERITGIDRREADHFSAIGGRLTELSDLVAGIGRIVQDQQGALARLADSPPADRDADEDLANPVPKWWSSQPSSAANRCPGSAPG